MVGLSNQKGGDEDGEAHELYENLLAQKYMEKMI
jgi:hypothetical protein